MRRVAIVLVIAAFGAAFWWYGSSYVVTWQAARIAGDRPYCISVPSHQTFDYDAVKKRQQMAFAHMWAGYVNTGGSMGFYQDRNHALLILADPPAVMNWSYKAMNFRDQPLLSTVYDHGVGPFLGSFGRKSCDPRQSFAATLRW